MRKLNESIVVSRPGTGTGTPLKALVAGLALLTLAIVPASAGTDMKAVKPGSMPPSCCTDNDWTIEVTSGVQWSNVRTGQPNKQYTIVPLHFTASLKLDDVSLDNFLGGWLRGYSEFYFEAQYDQIVKGPENHFEGLMVGPRYNFVQPGWKFVPFIQGGVAFGFADSQPQAGGLGEDFNFSFGVAAGVRYNITDEWFMRLSCEYQHISNAGMSEPGASNHPIDMLGPTLSAGYAF